MALERVTVKFSFGSTVVSPWTLTVITLLVSQGAKLTTPLGNTPPTKSAALAGLVPVPVTAQLTLLLPEMITSRVTVKVKALLPLLPSVRLLLAAAMVRVGAATSSLLIVPVAVAVVMVAPLVALERVTVKFSFGSNVVSPWTLTVITLLVSPGAKLTVPDGKTPPTKSVALAGKVPLLVTAQLTLLLPVVLAERVTVKVKALLPLLPSV